MGGKGGNKCGAGGAHLRSNGWMDGWMDHGKVRLETRPGVDDMVVRSTETKRKRMDPTFLHEITGLIRLII